MLTIPVERGGNLRPREPANPKPTHLPQLLREFALDIQPRLTGVGIRVGLGLAPIKFSGERIGDRRSPNFLLCGVPLRASIVERRFRPAAAFVR
jgi:hypothetical protein